MDLEESVNLKHFSNFRIGGPAKYFKEAESISEVIEAVRKAEEYKLPVYITGQGTNILWSDSGFIGLVLKPNLNFIEFDGFMVAVGAGVLMSDLVSATIGRGLAGLEWAGGLPGTFGGAIYGNAGAFGGEMKDIIGEVVSLNLATLEIKRRENTECLFGYRNSIFKLKGNEIILRATVRLRPADKRFLYESVMAKIKYRQNRHPLEYPNIGSIFKNVAVKDLEKETVRPHQQVIKTDPFPVIPAAYLIDKAGLKGISAGGAMISPRHPNFIVNVLDARASDVTKLIQLIKNEVKDKLDIPLEEEVRVLV